MKTCQKRWQVEEMKLLRLNSRNGLLLVANKTINFGPSKHCFVQKQLNKLTDCSRSLNCPTCFLLEYFVSLLSLMLANNGLLQSILQQILCKRICHITSLFCRVFFCKLTDDLRLCLSCSGVGDRDSASMLGGVVLLCSPVVTLSVPC